MINDSLRFVESILRLVSQQQPERALDKVRKRARREWTTIERETAREQESAQQPQPNAEAEARDWWVVLDVSPEASDDEIRSSYTAKLTHHHPTRANDLP